MVSLSTHSLVPAVPQLHPCVHPRPSPLLPTDPPRRVYIHRAAPPPVTGVRPKLITAIAVGGTFVDTVRGVGLEFTSLNAATDTAVVTLMTPPSISSQPTSAGSVVAGTLVTFNVVATGYRNTYVGGRG